MSLATRYSPLNMILLLDNYDSFVFNLARYLAECGCEASVVRSDAITVQEIRDLKPQAILVSPGPCTPDQAGVSIDVVRELGDSVPILGVCLGHQAIGVAYGGTVIRAPQPVHGRTCEIHHNSAPLFEGLPNPFRATRYHSLIVEEASLSGELLVTARSDDGLIMAMEHTSKPVWGVQFHPESILTADGHRLLANWLNLAGIPASALPPAEIADFAPGAKDDWSESGQPLHW